jgi:outer membrane cobalamin receptor
MKTLISMNAVFGKITRMIQCALFIIICILFAPLSTTLAQEEMEANQETLDAIDEEIRWLEAETYVITPSKIPETIKKTAASVTIVTDKQIRQMGAKHLDDVLWRVVPSYYSWHHLGSNWLHARGGDMSRILVMINSLPVYDMEMQGSLYNTYNSINVDNVKRIEFIRGPGSATYGANAYHGVINIITKKTEDVNGFELSARGGSWDTQQYNLLFGKAFTDLEVVFNFNYFKTHGHSAFIKQDVYTLWDQYDYVPLGYPHISLTPGYTKENEEKYQLALNVKYKGFMFDGGYIDRQYNRPLSIYRVLTEKSTRRPETYYMTLGYETVLGEKLDLSAKAYRLFEESIVDDQTTPPGYIDLWSGNAVQIWPEGMLYIRKNKSSRMGMEIQATYRMSNSNTIVAGATYEKQKFYDDESWSNYSFWTSEGLIYLPSMQKRPDELLNDNEKNDFKALFLEDVWDIRENLRLTLGARYDDYSSFGGHFSPRAGLTWEFIKGYHLKLLYGHAFSVPDLNEIRQQVLGTTLEPQTIDSYELSLGAEFTPSFESRVTFFRFYDKDLITPFFAEGYTNLGESRSQGVEVEARYDFGRGTWVAGNYSYTSMKDGYDPRIYLGKIMANIRLCRYLNLYLDGYHIGGWKEEPWDLSDYASGRTIVNATLIARNFLKGYKGLELRGSVYNLFDKDYAISLGDVDVPYGWPQPGVNFLVEVRYKF